MQPSSLHDNVWEVFDSPSGVSNARIDIGNEWVGDAGDVLVQIDQGYGA